MPNIDDLRTHLFDTLAALKDKDAPMDLDRAKTIAAVGKVIVETAKVEVDFLKVTNATQSTGFIPQGEKAPGPRRLAPREAAALPAADAGDRCVLCGCKLTTAFNIDRGLCGSCRERPEAKTVARVKALA